VSHWLPLAAASHRLVDFLSRGASALYPLLAEAKPRATVARRLEA